MIDLLMGGAMDAEMVQARLAALADPTRMAILARLRVQDQCVCHLVEDLDLKQSVVSHHVGVLRRVGLLMSYAHATDRRWLYYRLNRTTLAEVEEHLNWLRDDHQYVTEPRPCAADEKE